jgi:hypothetical protein
MKTEERLASANSALQQEGTLLREQDDGLMHTIHRMESMMEKHKRQLEVYSTRLRNEKMRQVLTAELVKKIVVMDMDCLDDNSVSQVVLKTVRESSMMKGHQNVLSPMVQHVIEVRSSGMEHAASHHSNHVVKGTDVLMTVEEQFSQEIVDRDTMALNDIGNDNDCCSLMQDDGGFGVSDCDNSTVFHHYHQACRDDDVNW